MFFGRFRQVRARALCELAIRLSAPFPPRSPGTGQVHQTYYSTELPLLSSGAVDSSRVPTPSSASHTGCCRLRPVAWCQCGPATRSSASPCRGTRIPACPEKNMPDVRQQHLCPTQGASMVARLPNLPVKVAPLPHYSATRVGFRILPRPLRMGPSTQVRRCRGRLRRTRGSHQRSRPGGRQ